MVSNLPDLSFCIESEGSCPGSCSNSPSPMVRKNGRFFNEVSSSKAEKEYNYYSLDNQDDIKQGQEGEVKERLIEKQFDFRETPLAKKFKKLVLLANMNPVRKGSTVTASTQTNARKGSVGGFFFF